VLPADHEIFNYPIGSRRAIGAKYLDIGIQLSRIEEKIDNLGNNITNTTLTATNNENDVEFTKPDKAKIINNIMQGFGID